MINAGKLYVCFITIMRLLISTSQQAWGQDQLVLMRQEHVLLRFNPGDEFVYKDFHSDQIQRPRILQVSDSVIVTERGFVSLDSVERVFYPETKFYNKVGMKIIAAGILVFFFDCIKISQKSGYTESIEKGMPNGSLKLISVGLPIMFVKNKSKRVNYKHKLLPIRKESSFYERR
jgi:hypothetical protein